MPFRGLRAPIASGAFIVAVLSSLAAPAAHAGAQAALVQGDWMTEEGGVVTIATCGDVVCGKVTGVIDFGPDGRDHDGVNGTSTCGQLIVKAMRLGDDGQYHGTITDPTNNNVYKAQMQVDDQGKLRLRGYVGIPLLGETRVWHKVRGGFGPNCHFLPAKS